MLQTAGAATPGVKDDDVNGEQPLKEEMQRKIRRWATLLNYMALDRADIAYAVKECARRMSDPVLSTERAIRRLGKYLRTNGRCRTWYAWQAMPDRLEVQTDSDW